MLGPLTDDERLALEVGGLVIDAADLLTNATGDDTTDAVLQVLGKLPAVVGLVMGLLAGLRTVIVRARELGVEVGPLGPGVRVESTSG